MRLALAAVLFTILSIALAAPAPENKYQKLADEMAWEWPKERANLRYCVDHYKGTFEIGFEPPGPEGVDRESLVKFKDPEGKRFFSVLAHDGTVFVESKNVLYYTKFRPRRSGCTLIAYDLQASKELWKADLKGLGPISHSKYRNAVILDIKEGALRVLGNESSGKYVEFVDMKTGKTVGHRVFKDEK
jgi:hypothetical protein